MAKKGATRKTQIEKDKEESKSHQEESRSEPKILPASENPALQTVQNAQKESTDSPPPNSETDTSQESDSKESETHENPEDTPKDPPPKPKVEIRAPLALQTDRSESIGNLALALSKAQGSMEMASKSTANEFFSSKYADLAECIRAAKKPLADNELAIVQLPFFTAGGAGIKTEMIHSSGEWISSVLTLKPLQRKPRNEGGGFAVAHDPQTVGSCLTYARRYAFAAMVGLAQEDDDGNSSSGRVVHQGSERRNAGSDLPF